MYAMMSPPSSHHVCLVIQRSRGVVAPGVEEELAVGVHGQVERDATSQSQQQGPQVASLRLRETLGSRVVVCTRVAVAAQI